MTATVGPRCLCTHSGWRHPADGHCLAPGCGCKRLRTPAPDFTPGELATVRRFENTRPAPESYREDDDEPPIPARFDERYDPFPDPIDRSIK